MRARFWDWWSAEVRSKQVTIGTLLSTGSFALAFLTLPLVFLGAPLALIPAVCTYLAGFFFVTVCCPVYTYEMLRPHAY